MIGSGRRNRKRKEKRSLVRREAPSGRHAQPVGAELRADLEIGAELEEEAVVVVAVGALLVAGAEVEVEAGIQLVTEPSGVGVVVG